VAEETSWGQLIQRAERRHFVHLYGSDDVALVQRASLYLSEGLTRAEGALLVSTRAHFDALLTCLEAQGVGDRAALESEIVFVPAQEMLERVSVSGHPEWRLFESALTAALRSAQGQRVFRNVRVFGETVGLLWSQERRSDAQRLEGFWTRLLASQIFDLYTAYPIDIFGEDFRLGPIDGILSGRAYLVPTASDNRLRDAVERGMRDVLDSRAEGIATLMNENVHSALPPGEAAILWLRNNLPEQAKRILSRARVHYDESRRDVASESV
jgi:hypothetical protein